jgi:hypothetical protein
MCIFVVLCVDETLFYMCEYSEYVILIFFVFILKADESGE